MHLTRPSRFLSLRKSTIKILCSNLAWRPTGLPDLATSRVDALQILQTKSSHWKVRTKINSHSGKAWTNSIIKLLIIFYSLCKNFHQAMTYSVSLVTLRKSTEIKPKVKRTSLPNLKENWKNKTLKKILRILSRWILTLLEVKIWKKKKKDRKRKL